MRKYLVLIAVLSSTILVSAQVQVRDEPRHHNVFENQFIRILDVHLGPRDTTLYHLHNTPSVFITLANVKVGSQLTGQQPQTGANISGLIMYDAIATPRIHRVWNDDTSWFHVMDIELIAGQPKNNVELIHAGDLKLNDDGIITLFNEKLVTGYRMRFSKGQTMKLPSSKSGYLLASTGNAFVDITLKGTIQHRNMKAGHYVWLDGKEATTITSDSIADYILLQLK
jgi:hypothetical protein